MSKRKQKRDELRRRQKRREQHRPRVRPQSEADALLRDMMKAMQEGPMDEFPGACHSSVTRPDMVKLGLGTFIQDEKTGRSQLERLERQYRAGKLGFLPNIEHWAMEEFFWHGAPGEAWNPLEAFLQLAGDQFPAEARQQLRRWKEAELKVLEIGEVRDATVQLRPWNVREAKAAGAWFPAIDLSISGVKLYRPHAGSLTLTYVAPWAPDEDLFCAMGYGMILAKEYSANLLMPKNLSDARLACSRWPWNADSRSEQEYASQWRRREWQGWFEQRVAFPFEAVVLTSEGPSLETVVDIPRVPPDQAWQMGIYFGVRCGDTTVAAGATAVFPLDMSTPNAATFAEYRAYRKLAGPPPRAHMLGPMLGR